MTSRAQPVNSSHPVTPEQVSPDERHARLDGPIHTWFELSYANYQVLHRTLMQSMPVQWQQRMVACMEELRDAFAHIEQAETYDIVPGDDRYLSDLTDEELARVGFRVVRYEDEVYYGHNHGWTVDANEAASYHVVLPKPDPVPHYNRGRTFIEPGELS